MLFSTLQYPLLRYDMPARVPMVLYYTERFFISVFWVISLLSVFWFFASSGPFPDHTELKPALLLKVKYIKLRTKPLETPSHGVMSIHALK